MPLTSSTVGIINLRIWLPQKSDRPQFELRDDDGTLRTLKNVCSVSRRRKSHDNAALGAEVADLLGLNMLDGRDQVGAIE